MKADVVLDTSALCAFHLFENGRDKVAGYLESGIRAMHAVNAAEMCFTLSRRSPDRFTPQSTWSLLIRDGIDVMELADPFFLRLTAKIRLRAPALNIGDGFAVALVSALDVPVLTGDRAFLQAADYAKIELIR